MTQKHLQNAAGSERHNWTLVAFQKKQNAEFRDAMMGENCQNPLRLFVNIVNYISHHNPISPDDDKQHESCIVF